MKNFLNLKSNEKAESKYLYQPQFFRIRNNQEKSNLEKLLKEYPEISVYDQILGQIEELIKCQNPQENYTSNDLRKTAQECWEKGGMDEYGVWVYYPWLHKIVHILDEAEFIQVRTNRNQYKIMPDEAAILSQKKIAIIGLSIGQSIALTMAMERIFKEIILADFDVVELSNMNRIRTGVCNLGVHKVVVVAREIAEIDPYLKVTVFKEGITEENIEPFLLKDGKADLLVEVCDSIDIKFLSRIKAREQGIPVIMDTSDRGLIDIERFDLEPTRPLFHGLLSEVDYSKFKELSRDEKIELVLKILEKDKVSSRLKYSMSEIGKTINTWPQLASSVVTGGGVTTEMARKILLGQNKISGRFYFDPENIINGK